MVFAFLRLLLTALAVIAMAMSALLLIVFQTRAGVALCFGGLSLGAVVLFAMLAWDGRSQKFWRAAGIAFCAWLVTTVWIVNQTPTGRAPEGAAVQHRYVGGHDGFRRYAWGNLLPEIDQFLLGFKVVPAIDALFTRKQAAMLSGLTASIYAELEADPAFHELGSVMPEAYDELWRLPFDHGHYYLYIPPRLDRSVPQPALVFLHGSGGNFKAYSWLLSKVADELDMILIAPSYGMGNWQEPDTSRVVRAALDDAAKVVSLDAKNVHLMGLSNGGLGVSQAGRNLGESLRSLTFLSPVVDSECISSREFSERWRGRPILVVSGGKDDRVPIDDVAADVEIMTQAGANVTFRNVEDADHFMLFSHRASVVRTVTDWLRSQLAEARQDKQER
jgi:pimeloyl-ACP methyl ester carboxylesterase